MDTEIKLLQKPKELHVYRNDSMALFRSINTSIKTIRRRMVVYDTTY